MKITVLNGSPAESGFELDSYLRNLEKLLESSGHQVSCLTLRRMNLHHCIGCWACWVTSPGKCVLEDEAATVCEAGINADFLIFASPVIMGFTSALLKKASDRMIPLIHPYFEIVNGEVHHQGRYEKYPALGLLLEQTGDTDEEDIEIIGDIYSRIALNLKSKLCFRRLTSDPVEEVADEINRA